MASSSLSLAKEEGEARNWADLPPELTSSILSRLGVIEILKTAKKVCKSWYRVCKDPSMWRRVDLSSHGISSFACIWMCRQVVDLSEGGLVEIRNLDFYNETHFNNIVNRSSNLRSLGLTKSLNQKGEVLAKALAKLPLLEELEISPSLRKYDLKAIGQACPKLKTLKLDCSACWQFGNSGLNDYALEIAESMPQLRHLELISDRLTETGLNAMLDNLPHLSHLDLSYCPNINFVRHHEKRCLKKIKKQSDNSRNGFLVFSFCASADQRLSFLRI